MGQISHGQRIFGLVVVGLVDLIAVGILIMTLGGWIDLPIVVPLLLVVASGGLLVGFIALGQRSDSD